MNCDPLARSYRWLEYVGFGRALERRRLAFLPQLTRARKVLMLGEGDGRFLTSFLRANAMAEVDYVDSSAKMLALARQRVLSAGDRPASAAALVRFHRADALTWLRASPLGEYDLVCTHFFLDCFTSAQLDPLAEEIARHLAVRACWVVSEFCYPPGGLAGWGARVIIGLLYRFFWVTTGLEVRRLPGHGKAIRATGLELAERIVQTGGLLVSELWKRG